MGKHLPIACSAIFLGTAHTAFKALHDIELPEFLATAGHYQFLTNIALCLSTLYFTVNFLYHSLKLKNLYTIKNYLSATCLSLNIVVSLVYWSLKIFLPDLILAKGESIPLLLDLKIHLMPLLLTSIDYFFFMDRWNISYLTGYAIISACATLYWFWLEYLIVGDASYPYPFLNVEKNLRLVIFSIISGIAFSAFCLGKLLHPTFIHELELAEDIHSNKFD